MDDSDYETSKEYPLIMLDEIKEIEQPQVLPLPGSGGSLSTLKELAISLQGKNNEEKGSGLFIKNLGKDDDSLDKIYFDKRIFKVRLNKIGFSVYIADDFSAYELDFFIYFYLKQSEYKKNKYIRNEKLKKYPTIFN